jgi:hypothetical protein
MPAALPGRNDPRPCGSGRNSARRAGRLKREIAKHLGKDATLIDTTVVDSCRINRFELVNRGRTT